MNSKRILADLTNNSGMDLYLKFEIIVWQLLSKVAVINYSKLNKNNAKSAIAWMNYNDLSFFSGILKFGSFLQLYPYAFRLKNFISILFRFMPLSLSSINFKRKMNFNLDTIAFQPLRMENGAVEGFGPGYALGAEVNGVEDSLKEQIAKKYTTIVQTRLMIQNIYYLNNFGRFYVNFNEFVIVKGLLSSQLADITPEIRYWDVFLNRKDRVKRIGQAKDFYSMFSVSLFTHYQAHREEQESQSLQKFSVLNLNMN